MQTRAIITAISINYRNKKTTVLLETDASASALESLLEKDLTLELKEYRKRRSLDANSYYWAMLCMLADKLMEPKPYIHNLMLRRYGQLDTADGKVIPVVLRDTPATERKADLSETFHLKPTQEVRLGNDGNIYRTWLMLRGSHDLDTAEFSRLLNGLLDECHEQGIETLPPERIKQMMEMYETQHHKGQ